MSDQSMTLGTGALSSVAVARKPVLAADDKHSLLGYELMFSDAGGLFSAFTDIDDFKATSEVVSHSVLTLGVDAVVGDALAFIRFPKAQVVDSTPLMMPPAQSVIEVGRDTWAARDRDALIAKLVEYQDAGYQIGLTDFVWLDSSEPFVALADYVKLRLVGKPAPEIADLVERFHRLNTKIIAADVDTMEARDAMVAAGVDYVSGYYYSEPNIVEGRELPGFKMAYLQLLRKAYAMDVDFDELAEIVKSDVALSYKLLRYVNSAAMGLRVEVESVQRALVMLGVDNVRRWVSVATVSGLVDPRPQELAVLCATRARFCESLGSKLGVANPHDCFSVGMFSLLDVMLGKTLEEALADVPTSTQVDDALHGRPGVLTDLLEVVVAYERGQWQTVTRTASQHGWPETELIGLYIEAIEWGRDFFGTNQAG